MADTDGMLDMMKRAGIAITRESYIACAWGEPRPEPWTAELESELPEQLQDWSQFVTRGADVVYIGDE